MPERAAVGMVPFFSARTMRRLTKKMTTQPRSSTLRNRSPTPFHAEGLRREFDAHAQVHVLERLFPPLGDPFPGHRVEEAARD